MADERKEQLAASIYESLTARLKEIGIRSFEGKRDEDGDYVIEFKYTGDDLPMTIYIILDVDRQMIRVISPLPVHFKEEQMKDGAMAVCAINNRIVNGRFELNVVKGNVSFNLCNVFMDSLIGDKVFDYVVGVSINTIDEYNDKLFMMAKGMLELDTLLKDLNY